MSFLKKHFVFLAVLFFPAGMFAQTITTAVPFLRITPDARAAGMGETGVASSPDVYSMHWNVAKLAFAENKYGIGASYTPWLRSLVPNVNHSYLSLYMKPDSFSAFTASMRYFSYGTLTMSGPTGVIGQYKPYELAADLGYSRRIAKYWSAGMALRYIHSNLTNGISVAGQATTVGKSFAFDLGVYYLDRERVEIFDHPCVMMMGAALTNVGNKVSYIPTDEGDFIPINLRIGQGFGLSLNALNVLTLQYEFNKLLVPSPPVYALNANGMPATNANGQYIIAAGKDPNVPVFKGMMQSFSDAPGGAKEELAEITFAIGAEYAFNKMFFIRTGYFYEAPTKGNRQFMTIGAGIKFNFASLDFAYLIPVNDQRSPLQNTLRFSLQFQFDRFKKKAPPVRKHNVGF